ncbi:type II secretion system F family protein [Muricoccus aerilatus]|uniref:type II secretion system F family protein n=1 Tax=Muricoccus aerilatus TaxID=452982 RepID=UPI000B01C728|nr:type II secretion system F family protein [Roseomonas aerilata]
MTTANMPLMVAAIGAAVCLAMLAALLLGRAAEDRDLSVHLRRVVRDSKPGLVKPSGMHLGWTMLSPVMWLGRALRNSAFVSDKDAAELQRAAAAAGLDSRTAVPMLIGIKATLLVLLPAGSLFYIGMSGLEALQGSMLLAGSLCLGILLPNWAVSLLRRPFQNRLRLGLPDALDLLVVAAEAGLGLETAVDRVAREMQNSNTGIALEFSILVQELRMLPDRSMALERMGERTGMEGFRRLGATLSQTLRYGTPLAQALRVLSAEMRQERMLRIEEKAIRLPALLVGPLILFILPALFIALIGPSVLEIGRQFSGSP